MLILNDTETDPVAYTETIYPQISNKESTTRIHLPSQLKIYYVIAFKNYQT